MIHLPDKVLDSLLDNDDLVVASSSMEPVLKPGDKIKVDSIDPDKISTGQVIVFKDKSGKLIVHRVIKRSNFVLTTAGDNIRKFDDPVHIHDVVGVVKDLERKISLSKYSRILRAVKRRLLSIWN